MAYSELLIADGSHSSLYSHSYEVHSHYSERLNKVVIARSEATWQSREIASLRSQ